MSTVGGKTYSYVPKNLQNDRESAFPYVFAVAATVFSRMRTFGTASGAACAAAAAVCFVPKYRDNGDNSPKPDKHKNDYIKNAHKINLPMLNTSVDMTHATPH